MTYLTRRSLLTTGAAALFATPALAASPPYKIPAKHRSKIVRVRPNFKPGEIHVDPGQFALYFILEDNKAVRYPVGIGLEGRYYSGTVRVARKAEWPRWTPKKAMIRRDPSLYKKFAGGYGRWTKEPIRGTRVISLFGKS